MQKGAYIWWEPLPEERPKWMDDRQTRLAAQVEKVNSKTGMVSIVGMTVDRYEWKKVVPVSQVKPRGNPRVEG